MQVMAIFLIGSTLSIVMTVILERWMVEPGEVLTPVSEFVMLAARLIALIGFAVVVVLLLAATAIHFVRPGFKVILDVVRYTGDQEYRDKLQQALAEDLSLKLENLEPGEPVYLLGHSLGSVLLVDLLVNDENLIWDRPIALVTGGSPIRRWFQRFFSESYFPSTSGTLVAALQKRHSELCWANVYRPQDPIGTSLDLSRHEGCEDCSTGQRHSVLRAHGDYWSDPDVARKAIEVVRNLHSAKTTKPDSSTLLSKHYMPCRTFENSFTTMTAHWLRKLKTIAISVLLILAIGSSVFHHVTVLRNKRASLEMLITDGRTAMATVEHRRVVTMPPTGQTSGSYDREFVLRFQDEARRERSISFTHVGGTDSPFDLSFEIDFLALERHVRYDGIDLEPNNRAIVLEIYQWYRAREPVEIIYTPKDWTVFDLPAFPNEKSWLGVAWIWGRELSFSVFGIFTLSFLVLLISNMLFFLFEWMASAQEPKFFTI
ncbi:MAG: hypothetical protein DWQ01_10960 [Planctomycetota bacterium]|nr:MAG: hypothetical protein DWQ01_10960 [Planctomycetota bacterium]